MNQDTIAAIATAMSNSGIGIVRISGPQAFSIAEKVFVPKNQKKKLSQESGYTLHYGTIRDEEELLDEVLVLLMRAPHSYTAEDTVEIDCHGGILILKRILQTVIKNGARLAEPGEFTKRAFLNGRIDLSQAEAVMDLIEAKSEAVRKNSLSQLRGSVQKKIRLLREQILYEIAFLESALDDPEHVSLDGYADHLDKELTGWLREIEKWLLWGKNGRILKEGIKTVIVGKPNAGKSSLLNALLGQERAIVTEIAGTTRDVLEEHLQMQEVHLNILDTAGIHETEDVVEKIGVSRAMAHTEDADLILYVVDASVPLTRDDDMIGDLVKDKKTIILLNKSDLETIITPEEMEERLRKPVISISAREEHGIWELEKAIENLFFQGELEAEQDLLITNLRQEKLLEDTGKSLNLVRTSIENQMPEDFYSIDLMEAYTSLGKILGEEVGEDLVNEIFGKFCMGK
ncbi:MAG: tRNA uridine-5-carboxymethylaminomethyl(34) synthesis GTPase MnmE [Lachnospiraceae bacterium]|jgi:tRNA modification GTPase|nr:tRNA uridine-5-carboxymethylaminomethyl(34) synthesis GTPase MnmE [Lachnospiraceae bacterium]